MAGSGGKLMALRTSTIKPTNQGKSSKATAPVSTLNKTCANAVRRALDVAPMPASAVVTALPMLAPMTTAAAPCVSIKPLCAAVNVMVMAALDDCINTVIVKPISSCNNSTSTPSAVPMAPLRRSWPAKRNSAPKPTKGKAKAKASTLNFKPTSATTQLVIVVPTLAPKTTHIAGPNSKDSWRACA